MDGLDPALLRAELARQSRDALVYPVLFGSAITGAGIGRLCRGIVDLLPAAASASSEPLRGTVFAIERDRAGHRFAVARLFSGSLAARDRITFARHDPSGTTVTESGRVTGVLDVDGRHLFAVVRCGGVPEASVVRGDSAVIEGIVPSGRLRELEGVLPGITGVPGF